MTKWTYSGGRVLMLGKRPVAIVTAPSSRTAVPGIDYDPVALDTLCRIMPVALNTMVDANKLLSRTPVRNDIIRAGYESDLRLVLMASQPFCRVLGDVARAIGALK